MCLFPLGSPLLERQKGGKTWLIYEERLKRIQMMTRKNNERIIEKINADVDHNNGVIM